ncbi:MAG: hypothetical protein ACE5OO_03795 [Candidatus Bathyarchaeia archaeon]
MRKLRTALWALYWMFFGVALHDYAHQVWELKGFHNLVEGGYIGFIGAAASMLGLYLEVWKYEREKWAAG